jgi:SOS-response transcriptional repressor LexA
MAKTKDLNPDIGKRIKGWREGVGLTRLELSLKLGVGKTSVSNWELGQNEPNSDIYAKLAMLAKPPMRWWFLEKAGLSKENAAALSGAGDAVGSIPNLVENRTIQIHGTAGAGPNRFPVEEAEYSVALPRIWFKDSQEIKGLRAVGNSMSPLIQDGFLVLIDIHDNKDYAALEGKIVAARNDEGCCVKWLVKTAKTWELVSQNADYAPIDVKAKQYAIVGRVIRWVGVPPNHRK